MRDTNLVHILDYRQFPVGKGPNVSNGAEIIVEFHRIHLNLPYEEVKMQSESAKITLAPKQLRDLIRKVGATDLMQVRLHVSNELPKRLSARQAFEIAMADSNLLWVHKVVERNLPPNEPFYEMTVGFASQQEIQNRSILERVRDGFLKILGQPKSKTFLYDKEEMDRIVQLAGVPSYKELSGLYFVMPDREKLGYSQALKLILMT